MSVFQEVEFGCGRVMSDVSSMFIVYLLELQTWYQNTSVTSAVLRDLWPHAKRAAEWQMNISSIDGIPHNLVDTYDILGLSAYRHSTYSAAFHLLAMKAAEKLAYQMGELPPLDKTGAIFKSLLALLLVSFPSLPRLLFFGFRSV